MTASSFGQWLKRQRQTAGLTQEQLARWVGCATITVRKIEADERRPSEQMVARLAEILSISSEERTVFLHFARGGLIESWRRASLTNSWRLPNRSSLPVASTSFIGREVEVARIVGYLRDPNVRLVTVIGPPGVGKTRLAIESARVLIPDFPDGVFLISLADLESSILIVAHFIKTLGLVDINEGADVEWLKQGIGNKEMLVLIDNCEHLTGHVAALVADLLSACSGLKILATSRETLHIPGEWLLTLSPLEIPQPQAPGTRALSVDEAAESPALALFVARASAVQHDFALTPDNLAAIVAICERVDGLPLGIELVASRTRLMSPHTILSRMDGRFILSANGTRTLPVRQQTLEQAIFWSYELLSYEERSLFMRLSVFSGGFTIAMAERALPLSGNCTTLELVSSLFDKSLLHRVGDPINETRYHMLVPIRQFAQLRLSETGREREDRNRHLTYFLDYAEQADERAHGPNQVDSLERLEAELDNFRAALDWAIHTSNTEASLRLLSAMAWTWTLHNQYSEMLTWFNRLSELLDVTSYRLLYATLSNRVGRHASLVGDHRTARPLLVEADAIWRTLGDDAGRGVAEVLHERGKIAIFVDGNVREGQTLFEQSLALSKSQENDWAVAANLLHLGAIRVFRGEFVAGVEFLEESMRLFRERGDLWGIARTSSYLGDSATMLGEYGQAALYYHEQLTLDTRLKNRQGVAVALAGLGNLSREQGDYDLAVELYHSGLALCRFHGLKTEEFFLYILGVLALEQGDYAVAKQYFEDYHRLVHVSESGVGAYQYYFGMAAIAAATGQPERAAWLFGVVQAIQAATGYDIPPSERATFERHLKSARDHLGAVRFESIVMEGRGAQMRQAIVFDRLEALKSLSSAGTPGAAKASDDE